ncbi:putative quinol monooxygenase [Alloalcanivorax venustensis]|uniref:putative quinol monooxygenase n=1 Tax=Alloalcanivorax venustensis TaxID=172371 RepID=UPI002B171199|nr:antibiotic biosynthesis monooxygenase [Pseudomonadota bacterium]MEC8880399.1 antibiotic biosynthesis monooxygenase [Pseudomonadota bacterium]
MLTGRIIVPDGDFDGVVDALSTHIDLSRQEKGCLKFEVTQSAEHNNTFIVYEIFADKAAFQRRQECVRDSAWGADISELRAALRDGRKNHESSLFGDRIRGCGCGMQSV